MNKQKLTCNKARELNIIDVLKKLGSSPVKDTDNDAWFLSPFREEKKASFKVSKKLNSWFDHGLGKGGNVIDLIVQLKGYSVKETLAFLDENINSFSFHQQTDLTRNNTDKKYQIIKVKKLDNQALLDYLISRKISLDIAKKYCKEIYYKLNQKNYFAICFENEFGGYEIRNKYYKGSLLKKGFRMIKNHSNKLIIFEGFIDFLSYLTIFNNKEKEDYLILNSISFIENIIPFLKNYNAVFSYLDNDNSGKKAMILLSKNHTNIRDCSLMYSNHNDLNDYLTTKNVLKSSGKV